jgi:hypothetical protein
VIEWQIWKRENRFLVDFAKLRNGIASMTSYLLSTALKLLTVATSAQIMLWLVRFI